MGVKKPGGSFYPIFLPSRAQLGSIYSHPGGYYNGGVQEEGIPGVDVVRPYNGVPKNALDLALDCAGTLQAAMGTTMAAMLVTAGAEMTGNSTFYQRRAGPYTWRRQKGSKLFFGPDGYQGRRLPPQGEAAIRRVDQSGVYADTPMPGVDDTTLTCREADSSGDVIGGEELSDDSQNLGEDSSSY